MNRTRAYLAKSLLFLALSGCSSAGEGSGTRRLPGIASLTWNSASATGVRRWRLDERRTSPAPDWDAGRRSDGPCPLVLFAGAGPLRLTIGCCPEVPAGLVRADFETRSKFSLGASDPLRVEPRELCYCMTFSHPILPSVGAGDGVLVFTFASSALEKPIAFARIPLRLYSILGTPNLPWVATPDSDDNPHAPWLRALEMAVRWARGARTPHEAASLITYSIFALGLPEEGSRLQWEGTRSRFCTNYALEPARAAVSVDRFYLAEFLDALERKGDPPQAVDCHDVAAAVYTFSNLLGCNLGLMTLAADSSTSGEEGFTSGHLRPLGVPGALKAISLRSHQVAWWGGADGNGMVYDACFAFPDGARPLPACGMRYGIGADGDGYLARLNGGGGQIVLSRLEQRCIAPVKLRDLGPASGPGKN